MRWKINEYPKYASAIREAERIYNIPRDLLGRVLFQESQFEPGKIAGKGRHKYGAIGIAGFMPIVASKYGLISNNTDLRYDPTHSIFAAAQYLRDLRKRFTDWKTAVMAFQWGQENVVNHKHKTETYPLPIDTSQYVAQILADVQI